MNGTYIDESIPGAEVLYLNASSLKISGCQRHYGMLVQGYQGVRGGQEILDFGNAVHKAAETFTRTAGDLVESIGVAHRAYPKVDKQALILTMSRRGDIYIIPPYIVDEQLCVEITFNKPWLAYNVDGRLIQVNLCGTIDHLSWDKDGVHMYDYKTTRYALVQYALEKYKHDTQFQFYQWIMHEFGSRWFPLEVFNDMHAGRMDFRLVVVQVQGKSPRWTIDAPRSMTEYQYEQYGTTLRNEVDRYVQAYLIDHVHDLHPCGRLFNGCTYCQYSGFCHAPSLDKANEILSSYTVNPYNPIKDRGESPDQK